MPWVSGPETRTVLPEDFGEAELDVLIDFLPSVDDPALTARLNDLLWVRRRDYRAARRAVDAYVDLARRLEVAGHDAHAGPVLTRATDIAARVGGGADRDLCQGVLGVAAEIVRARLASGGRLHSLPVMDLLIARRYGDLAEWVDAARGEGDRLVTSGHLHRGLTWYRRASDAAQAGGLDDIRSEIERAMANANLVLADRHPTQMGASSFLRSAIRHLRHVPGTADEQDSLHARMREAQQESVQEYGTISRPMDLGDQPERAAAAVAGLDPMEALFTLGVGMAPLDEAELRAVTMRSAQDNPLLFLIPTQVTDQTGRVVGSTEGGHADEEQGIRDAMVRDARLFRAFDVAGHILPMRAQIHEDHGEHLAYALEELVTNNWFVPPSRRRSFSRGLRAGFSGDFMLVGNLLIPQVEHAVRDLLDRLGVVTSSIRSDDRQNEFALTVTLVRDDLVAALAPVLTSDAVYDLRTLLVDPLGPNLRNNAMHGLVDDGEFVSRPFVYFWWLVLWLVCQGYTGPLPDGISSDGGSEDETGDESASGTGADR